MVKPPEKLYGVIIAQFGTQCQKIENLQTTPHGLKRQLPDGIINLYTPEKDWHDMGIVIYAPYRGRGYGVTALKLMLDHAFRELGVEDGFFQMMITREDYLNGNTENR